MNPQKKNLLHFWDYLTAAFVAAVSLFVLFGCLANYGSLKSNSEITRLFSEKQVPLEYRYYYCGRENFPYAIIGVQRDLTFNLPFWVEVDPKSDDFTKMLEKLYSRDGSGNPIGAEILNPQQQRVGIWYSNYRYTVVKTQEDGSLSIYSPYSGEDYSKGPT